MAHKVILILAFFALRSTFAQLEADFQDYEVELDPGEEVVLGRFGGRAEKISLKLGEIQDLFGITPEMKRAQKLNR